MIIDLVSLNDILVQYKGKVIGKIQSLSVDLAETPFWIPIPRVKLKLKLNYDMFEDIEVISIIKKIRDKLKRYKFVELV